MKYKDSFKSAFLFCLFLTAIRISASPSIICDNDGYSQIQVKEANVQGIPKGSSIQASINGHWLSVVFLENLGQVNIEVTTIDNNEVLIESTPTPNGVNIYIAATGNFIVTFTLPNGDEYYGEFEISD